MSSCNGQRDLCSNQNRNQLAIAFTASTLSMVVTFLAIFNVYLLAWIWSSLDTTATNRVNGSKQSNWAKFDLLSSQNTIKFVGKLITKQPIEAKLISHRRGQQDVSDMLEISSLNSIQFETLGSENVSSSNFLQLIATEKQIQLPSRVQVKHPADKNITKLALICERPQRNRSRMVTASCSFKGTKKIVFSNRRGLRLSNRSKQSIESKQIESNRFHSATNRLNMISSDAIYLTSLSNAVQLVALDELVLSSHKSRVSYDDNDDTNIMGPKYESIQMVRNRIQSTNLNAIFIQTLLLLLADTQRNSA